MKTGHTSTNPGKRVLVLMRNGEHFIAKFKDKPDNRTIEFYDHEPIKTNQVRTLAIYKGDTHA